VFADFATFALLERVMGVAMRVTIRFAAVFSAT
jgi:hypothetical protein